MTEVRKKWIVVWKLNVDGISREQISDVLEVAKSSLGENLMDEFFGTKTMVFFVPVKDYLSSMEVHEIILDAVGYDKYDAIIQNTNLEVREVLDQLKELLDV